jgi:hypothetical protein
MSTLWQHNKRWTCFAAVQHLFHLQHSAVLLLETTAAATQQALNRPSNPCPACIYPPRLVSHTAHMHTPKCLVWTKAQQARAAAGAP